MILNTAKPKSGGKDAMQEYFSKACREQDGAAWEQLSNSIRINKLYMINTQRLKALMTLLVQHLNTNFL